MNSNINVFLSSPNVFKNNFEKGNVIFILGNTERTILENIEDIVNKSLLIDKVTNYYKEVKGASRDVVLGYVTFTNEVKNVSILIETMFISGHHVQVCMYHLMTSCLQVIYFTNEIN